MKWSSARSLALAACALALGGCGPDKDKDTSGRPPTEGLLGLGPAFPFPNRALMQEGKLDLPLGLLPAGAATPLPVDRLSWRDGFSGVQTLVVPLPGIATEGLPGPLSPPGTGTVRLWDRATLLPVAVMAELDAYPEAPEPALLIRPLQALPPGSRLGVAVLTGAVARPEAFQAALDGEEILGAAEAANEVPALLAELEGLGVAEDEVALTWDLPIGDGSRPLRTALDQVAVPTRWAFDRVRDLAAGDSLPPMTARALEGTFETTNFLVDDRLLSQDASGAVAPTGQTQARLYVHIPSSVIDAPAESVPVLLFGHGIFSEAADYLDDEEDSSGVLQLAEEGGYLVVATDWRGLTWNDRVEAIAAAQDFGQFNVVTERLVQGQANQVGLARAVLEGGLLDDPLLLGASGQRLAARGDLAYYGISLGGIEGAVLLAQDLPLRAGALHVGGSSWGTMLERSANWIPFELFLVETFPNPTDRQVLYALSQLWWDPVDPITYALDLRSKKALLQVAIGDEQVPNLTSEALARTVGWPQVAPVVYGVPGLEEVADPLPSGSSAFVQLDPELGAPPMANRPAEPSGAHDSPRRWPGTRRQILEFLRPGSEGTVVHPCGASPCSTSNPGE